MSIEDHANAVAAIRDFDWAAYDLNPPPAANNDWASDLAAAVLDAVRPEPLTTATCNRIRREVANHPRRDLIETIAEATYDIDGEDGGGGKVWHLAQAHALVSTLPGLRYDEDRP
jgi:hypothetical protein